MSNQVMAVVFWVLGTALFILGFLMWRTQRMTAIKKEKPNIYGITEKQKIPSKMKADWDTGQTAGEQFGLEVRQKVIKFFKGDK